MDKETSCPHTQSPADIADGTAVVILNWNGRDFLEKFLPPLLSSIGYFNACHGKVLGMAEVIVADNASTDGSMEMMKEKFPQVRTMAFDRNYGFTGGYNKAFKEIQCKYFLLINSDIEVPRDWLAPLVKWMEQDQACGICSPKLHSWQDREMFEYAGAAGGYIDRLGFPFCRGRIMKKTERDTGQYDTPAAVFWATGACLMIRASVYRELGGLDERFFAHMEEIDLCWRAQLAGWKIMVIPDSVVYHIGGGTLPQNSPWKLYLNFRNNLMMLDNNLAKTYALESSGRKGMAGNISREDILKLSDKAAGKARRTITFRMLLDGCAAAIYLMTFRIQYFKAVVKAHRDFRKMRKGTGASETAEFLVRRITDGKDNEIHGFFDGLMIPRALLGMKIFR